MDWTRVVVALACHSHVLAFVIVACFILKRLPWLIAAFRVAIAGRTPRPNGRVRRSKRSNPAGIGSGRDAAKAADRGSRRDGLILRPDVLPIE